MWKGEEEGGKRRGGGVHLTYFALVTNNAKISSAQRIQHER